MHQYLAVLGVRRSTSSNPVMVSPSKALSNQDNVDHIRTVIINVSVGHRLRLERSMLPELDAVAPEYLSYARQATMHKQLVSALALGEYMP